RGSSVYVAVPTPPPGGLALLPLLGALAFIVALHVALPLPGHPQRASGAVVDDRRAGRRPGVVAHLDGSDEGGVDAAVDPVPDAGAVLAEPVVVGGDAPGADVGLLAHVGVAHVAEGGHLGARADVGG